MMGDLLIQSPDGDGMVWMYYLCMHAADECVHHDRNGCPPQRSRAAEALTIVFESIWGNISVAMVAVGLLTPAAYLQEHK